MHQLPIKELLKNILIVVCVSCVIFMIVMVLLVLIKPFIKHQVSSTGVHALLLFLSIVLTTVSYVHVRRFVRLLMQSLFQSSHRDVGTELHALANDILAVVDSKELANTVVNGLTDIFDLQHCALLTRQEDGAYTFASASGFTIQEMGRIQFLSSDVMVRVLRECGTCVTKNVVVTSLSWQDASHASTSFAVLRAVLLMPLFFQGDLIGILSLGARHRGKTLSRSSIKALDSIIRTVSVAVHNAMVLSSLKRLNHGLVSEQSQLLMNAKMSVIEKLAAGIAHEIHNPLTIISGKAQVLLLKKNQQWDTKRVEDVLQTIVQQTKRAADITRRLLMFSKAVHVEGKQLVSLESIILDTIELITYQVSLDNIKIVKTIESCMPRIEANPVEIRELLLNLLLNAVQAIGKSGTITIHAHFCDQEQTVRIRIADTGIGISEEHMKSIFDPFFTTYPENVGLGLFACQQIVHRLGGSIKVESKIQEGTLFIVMLPIAGKHQTPITSIEKPLSQGIGSSRPSMQDERGIDSGHVPAVCREVTA